MSTDDLSNPSPPAGGGGGGPSPQQIGSAFIKQYYKILLTAPAQLNRFYQPDSTVTRGMEPSAPATPVPFSTAELVGVNGNSSGGDESMGERVRKAFFDWASVKSTNREGDSSLSDNLDVLTVDFERGAIDAQESIGGGILLVVTGHMSLPGKVGKKSAFVHTFFLNNAAVPGRKKQFLVKNDILRFLDPDANLDEKVVEEDVTTILPEVEEEQVLTISPDAAIHPVPLVPVEYEPSVDEEKVEDEDDEDIEPLKEPANESPTEVTESSTVESNSNPTTSPSSDGKKSKRNRGKKGRLGASKSRSRSNSPDAVEEEKEEEEDEVAAPEKPKAPSSWANLVASGGGIGKGSKGGRKGSPKPSRNGTADKSTSSVKPDLSSSKAPPQSRPTNGSKAVSNTSTSSTSSTSEINYQSKPSERTAEATLFIRNIPDKTKEPEIRALFEKQAAANGNKILGITLNPNRGFCFVDFDGPDAVVSIVAESMTSLVKDQRTGRKVESSFMAHGRVLEVERKVASKGFGGGGGGKAMDSGGGGGRKFNRSKSPKDGGENGGKIRDRRGGGNERRDREKIGGGGGGGGKN